MAKVIRREGSGFLGIVLRVSILVVLSLLLAAAVLAPRFSDQDPLANCHSPGTVKRHSRCLLQQVDIRSTDQIVLNDRCGRGGVYSTVVLCGMACRLGGPRMEPNPH